MRIPLLAAAFFTCAIAFAGNSPAPILRSHNEVRMVDQAESRSEDLQIFADGSVKYVEAPNFGKKQTFHTRLTALKLRQLSSLLNGKDMRAVPAKIGPQIKVIDGQIDKKLEIRHAGSQQHAASEQIIEIENFYPQLNAGRPAYPKVLVELECMLQDIQRKAAKRPAPDEDHDWCPDALGKR